MRFVTLSGVPVEVTGLQWPFHPSTSGADWFVLHGRVELLPGEEGLHADFAAGLTQTVKESLGSLDPEHAESLVINALRKTIDNGQIAFVKSGKLQPVQVTSRFYSFRARKIEFRAQPEQEVRELLKRRVFWLGRDTPTEIAHPYDCEYVQCARENMLDLARRMAAEGILELHGEFAAATQALKEQEAEIRSARQKGVEAGLAAAKVTA